MRVMGEQPAPALHANQIETRKVLLVRWCSSAPCVCVRARAVRDWPRNASQFSSSQSNLLHLLLLILPPSAYLPCCVCSKLPHSVIQSVRTTIVPLVLPASKPTHPPTRHLFHAIACPRSLETRTPTWEPGHQASLHHYIIQSFVAQEPQAPPPSCPLWHPWASNPTHADSRLPASLSALPSDCQLVLID